MKTIFVILVIIAAIILVKLKLPDLYNTGTQTVTKVGTGIFDVIKSSFSQSEVTAKSTIVGKIPCKTNEECQAAFPEMIDISCDIGNGNCIR